jgi:histidine triad (HIT) family protein
MHTEADCLFCRIASGELPADRVLETEDVVAFRDINPQAPTHVLVIPREHVSSLDAAEPRHAETIGRLHLAAARIAAEAGLAGGWRAVINVGANAGQTVFHVHLHLLGGRALEWPPG